MRSKRRLLQPSERAVKDAGIIEQLLRHTILKQSQVVGAYLPMQGEANIKHWFTEAWQEGKRTYLPIIQGEMLVFGYFDAETPLVSNRWGILEPLNTPLIPLNALDTVIVPLVAFDAKGNRLGQGKGYYDRSFLFTRHVPLNKKPHLLGVGYAFQKTTTLIPQKWDIPMHTIITENTLFTF